MKTGMLILFAAFAFASSCDLGAATRKTLFEAVRDGKAVSDIILPAKAHGIEQCAAEELAYHIEKATGVRLEIVPENKADLSKMPFHFFVGATEAAKAAGLPVGKLEHEERMLKTAGNALYLLGGDVPVAKRLAFAVIGPSARGTMYAVYDFLEEEMGVKWIWPGETGEYVPKASSLAFGAIDRRGIEPLILRSWSGLGRTTRDGNVYGWSGKSAKDRFHDAQDKFMVRHRIGQRVNFKKGHAFKNFVDRFLDTHPEYFQLKPDGTRGPWNPGKAGWNCSMCVSNPDLAKIVAEDWYKTYVETANKGPYMYIPAANACENDTPGACRCEKCRSWDGPDPRFKLNAYWNGSDKSPEMSSKLGIYGRLADMNRWGESATKPPTKYSANVSDRYAKFYNAVLAEARKKVPEARVVAYAYQNYLEGPINTKVDPGVIIDFVPRMYLPYDKAESDLLRTFWNNWRKAGVKDLVFRPNFTHALGGFPVDQARQYCEDIAWCADRGLFAITLDSIMGSYSAEAMHDYAITRSFRDPRRGYEKARADMLGAFGKAKNEINRYFDFIEGVSKAWTHESFEKIRMANPIYGGIFGGGFNRQANILGDFYSEKFFVDAYAMLDAAKAAAAGDEDVIARIEFLRKGIVNTELTRKTRIARKAYEADKKNAEKKAAFSDAFDAMNAYRTSIEGDFALNLHREAYNEMVQLQWPHKVSVHKVKK
jgi:hypothetical protein